MNIKTLGPILGFVLILGFTYSCSNKFSSPTYNGKPLFNDRFTYWEDFDIYVDTAFVNLDHLCGDAIRLDSSFIIQNLYKKKSAPSNREMLRSKFKCNRRSLGGKNPGGLQFTIATLVGQSGNIMAFHLPEFKSKELRKGVICYTDQKYAALNEPICFTREDLVITIGANRKISTKMMR